MTLGRKITVELNTGETLKGRMGPVSADQFNLEPRRQGQGTTRSVRFDEVRSVRSGLSGGQKWAVGVGIGDAFFLRHGIGQRRVLVTLVSSTLVAAVSCAVLAALAGLGAALFALVVGRTHHAVGPADLRTG